jgi:predicted adenylyl cyclase CyaB
LVGWLAPSMGRNIEIKARLENLDSLVFKVAALADEGPMEILQDDTFFHCRSGRLKLRALSNGEGQLIFYRRPDQAGPKESCYTISPTSTPDSLRETLSFAYGEAGRVRKHRTLFMIGKTRVHLDRVERLGHFLELEVVLSDDETVESGILVARKLMAEFGIEPAQLIEGAYIDLLADQVQP